MGASPYAEGGWVHVGTIDNLDDYILPGEFVWPEDQIKVLQQAFASFSMTLQSIDWDVFKLLLGLDPKLSHNYRKRFVRNRRRRNKK